MPELPEIKVVTNMLNEHMSGKQIVFASLYCNSKLKCNPENLPYRLIDRTVREVKQKGKYILINLDEGCWVVHLMLTGELICTNVSKGMPPYTKMGVLLNDNLIVAYADQLNYGRHWLFDNEASIDIKGYLNQGPEPFDKTFTTDYLSRRLCLAGSTTIKEFLLNQENFAGVGNTYADEILYNMRVLPPTASSALIPKAQELLNAIQQVLEDACTQNEMTFEEYCNQSVHDFPSMKHVKCYGHYGQKCPRCGNTFLKTRVGGKVTCYCPSCQT